MKKNLIKVLSIAMCMTMAFTGFAFAGNDAAEDNAVANLMNAGVVTGDVDGQFHPEQTLTRAQACTMIVKSALLKYGEAERAEKLAASGAYADKQFKDMAGYSWAGGYIGYAAENKIVEGYGDGNFKPGADVTMPELTAMILRAAGVDTTKIAGVWPTNYITAAVNAGLVAAGETTNGEITKGITAKMINAGMEGIKAADGSLLKFDEEVPAQPKDTESNADNNTEAIENDFSGRAMGPALEASTVVNKNGENVSAITMNIRGKKVEWRAAKGRDNLIPAQAEIETAIKNGDMFEVNLWSGDVKHVAHTTAAAVGNYFEDTSGVWEEVTKVGNNGIIHTSCAGIDKAFAIDDNAAVYILNADQDGYDYGNLGDICEGDFVRLYRYSKPEKQTEVEVVFLKRA